MSAIASFYIIKIDRIKDIIPSIKPQKKLFKTIDRFYEVLKENSIKTDTYKNTGYDIGVFIPFLDEQEITIAKNDYFDFSKLIADNRQIGALIIDINDKKILQDKKEKINQFKDIEISEYFEELYGDKDMESGSRIKELISQINSLMQYVDEESILLMMVG